MSEYDVELSVQRAKEKNPKENPRIITDNGPQYTSKEFQQFLKEVEFKHIRTSVGYPQSNGKIERFHRSLGEECLKTKSMISIEDAREVIGKYVEYYNTKRLHSALFYLTPEDYLLGRVDSRLKERELKIKNASIARKEYWSKKIVV
jgi:Transposase and inactivated derivatives